MNAPTATKPSILDRQAADVRIAPGSLLHRALSIDAAASGATGLALVAGASPLAGPLGLPVPLLLGAGAMMLVWGVCLGWLRRQPRAPRGALRLVVGLNLLWAADSLLLLVAGPVDPTAAGTAFVVAQAAAAAGFALAQHLGLRRARASDARRAP
ncbi:MAG TPA: hypothetical protein VEA81_15010 [Burkholderiaceae bacterium]|nr:hypothetical protein [Burkholderiaceae bacterium]